MFKNKNVLVTGGTGMIGIPLVEMLIEQGANVRIISLDDASRAHPKAEFRRVDLFYFDACEDACKDMDYVFHIAGIKGSPAMTSKRPASFFVPILLMNTNMMEAARRSGADGYLYTSTIGIYSPSEIFYEDDAWKNSPSENDKFAGWAKRMGELQAEAYKIEYRWQNIAIVRPANVYGPYDNFDSENAMVIPSIIKRALDGENPLVVWGDGSAVRDFIYSNDVAAGMLLAMERPDVSPVNLGSGTGICIKEIVNIITANMDHKPQVVWDITKPTGDKKRLMDISRAKSIGFKPSISIEEGIVQTMRWYQKNKHLLEKRYNIFSNY